MLHSETAPRILVVGGAGMLGAPVARALVKHGYLVRILGRTAPPDLGQDQEFIRGDVLDPESLATALNDCSGVHVSLRGTSLDSARRVEVGGAAAVAQACAERGLKLSYLSGAGLEAAPGNDAFANIKRDAEQAIARTSVLYTIFRATHFMESLPLFVRDGRAAIFGRQPHRYHYLAAADYADCVARSFSMPETARRTFDMLGPEAFTMAEALTVYLRATHPEKKLEILPLPLARLVARLSGKQDFQHAVKLFASFSRMPEAADPAPARTAFGPAPTTLGEWCAAKAAERS